MALTIRRLISWLGTLAVLGALAVGISRLPAQGGLVGELRWVFTQPIPAATKYSRTLELLWQAKQRAPDGPFNVMRVLLHDDDTRVVQCALVLVGDSIRSAAAFAVDWGARLFEEWFAHSTADQRFAHLPYTLLQCYWDAGSRMYAPHFAETSTRDEVAAGQLAPWRGADDVCWIVAGTLEKGPDWRPLADAGAFNDAAPTQHIRVRLLVLDALLTRDTAFVPTPLDESTLQTELRPPLEQVLSLLTDLREKVRWAAGRILTVAGDRRGLPAFREWLKAHPNIPPGATQMLAELFGPDWRTAP
ncbi:MAG: hypothetical protein KA383_10275 [Phycisphaerae bacterium]|nr:hypothetical protein [Phycisphaerae bacterium]